MKNIFSSAFWCCILLFSGQFFLNAQYISVDTNYTPEQLIQDIFFGSQNSGCITVTNVQINGWDFGSGNKSFGYFSRNGSSFEIEQGIVLSTGSALQAVGPNSEIQTLNTSSPFYTESWAGDQDLENSVNISNTHNATVLEFDFSTTLASKISFEYMFLSEQYLRQDDPGTCGYTDGFAFLIKKSGDTQYQNLALIPNTDIPITSNNVRGSGGRCTPENELYFGHYNNYESPTNFNGQTIVLEAKTDIELGVIYHMKLVIADQGNPRYDSAVFLKAGSFLGSQDLGPDRLFSLGNALCAGETLLLDATRSDAIYQWYQNGSPISGANSGTYLVQEPGFYEVEIEENNGCKLKGSIRIEYAEKPALTEQTFPLCDENLDGSLELYLPEYNDQIISNYNDHFVVKYYLQQSDAEAGNSNFLPDQYAMTASTTLFVRVENGNCIGDVKPVHFEIRGKIPLSSVSDKEICDNDLDGYAEAHLQDYVSEFTTLPGVSVNYFNTESDAQNNTNPISEQVTFNSDRTYYYRFETSELCPEIGSIHFEIIQPQVSSTLKNEPVCPDSTIVLDAGTGFTYYEWYSSGNLSAPLLEGTENTARTFETGIGTYIVRLYSANGCFHDHSVEVFASEPPVISLIEVNGSTATVFVTGGTGPFLYSLDNENFQTSNVFTDVPRGMHTVYVKSADSCYTVSSEFLILNLINVITPNGDGFNDTLNYSDLKIKNNVSVKIIDRFGKTVFLSEGENFVWDGKTGGRVVPTGTYWYILNWEEPVTNLKVSYTGWLLVKNRN